ncbi:hypothetical protein AB0C10_27595 [Microbispora amethystogenes]|uniref:hypothetical protein n=1 Tax=Microbispora amethystogenes TaxID=1427754 RepID=UPI0033F48CF5
MTELVRERVRQAQADGIEPGSREARTVLVELIAGYTATFGHVDSAEYRRKLLTRLEIANDPRTERYFALLSTINGWPEPPSLAPAFDWLTQALRHPSGPLEAGYARVERREEPAGRGDRIGFRGRTVQDEPGRRSDEPDGRMTELSARFVSMRAGTRGAGLAARRCPARPEPQTGMV